MFKLCLSVCLSVCLSIYLSIYLSYYPNKVLLFSLLKVNNHVLIWFCLFVCLIGWLVWFFVCFEQSLRGKGEKVFWGLYKRRKGIHFCLLSPVNCTIFHFPLLNPCSKDIAHLRNIQIPKAQGLTQ